MNVRIIVRDDGDAAAPPLHDAWHDTAIEPRPGYLLRIVAVPGYWPPVVEQCEIVSHGAGTALVCRCRAGRVEAKPSAVDDLDAASKPGPKPGAKVSRPVCKDCLAAGEANDRHRTADCPHRSVRP